MPGRLGIASLCLVASVALTACERKAAAPAVDAGASVSKTSAAAVKLCEHRVPAELCTKCNPELAEVFKEQGDWCLEHGVPESQCLQCNPALTFSITEAPADWCSEHSVPESMCTKCKPSLVAKFIASGDYCREHGFPQSVCPICNPDQAKADEGALPDVRLASEETVTEIGVKTVRARKAAVKGTLDVVGQLAFNGNRRAELSARGEALVIDVKVDVGDSVKKGQALLIIASAEVGSGQAQAAASKVRLNAARAAVAREKTLVERGISPRRSLEDAESEEARALSEYDGALSALAASGAGAAGAGGRHTVIAPIAGTVVRRTAVVGRMAQADEVLVEIADLSTLWALIELPEAEAALVRSGQPVLLTLEGRLGKPIAATISRVANIVDPATRTVEARVELSNPDQSLRAGAFVRARIEVKTDREALVLPKSALQIVGEKTVVFVRREANVFAPKEVTVGDTIGTNAEILTGVSQGDEVVTTGAFLLKTEVMKESIGAGCCDE